MIVSGESKTGTGGRKRMLWVALTVVSAVPLLTVPSEAPAQAAASNSYKVVAETTNWTPPEGVTTAKVYLWGAGGVGGGGGGGGGG
ncbi:hypothetical protein ACSNOK_32085, partial [Streptomyces sp. URMC 126]